MFCMPFFTSCFLAFLTSLLQCLSGPSAPLLFLVFSIYFPPLCCSTSLYLHLIPSLVVCIYSLCVSSCLCQFFLCSPMVHLHHPLVFYLNPFPCLPVLSYLTSWYVLFFVPFYFVHQSCYCVLAQTNSPQMVWSHSKPVQARTPPAMLITDKKLSQYPCSTLVSLY